MRRRAPREAAAIGLMLLRSGPDGTAFAVNAESENLARVLHTLATRPFVGRSIVVVTARTYADAILRTDEERILAQACDGLAQSRPELSARGGLAGWQRTALLLVPLALAAGLIVSPIATASISLGLAALFFSSLVLFRLTAGLSTFGREAPALPDAALPIYTVLVPLYREARVVERLIVALSRLDYPRAKLDIKILVERDDAETRAEIGRQALPDHFEIVVVPPAEPRTKPKALNFGLTLRRGSLVCIFDAEDAPDPGQLRLAAATFAAHPEITCLQARLTMFNWRDNWLSRQFALEYAVLFELILPYLDRLALPLPLGGTSNHFQAEILERLGGWDAYNVTEDADLGIRLARGGHRCATIASTTWEEAPVTLEQWIPQRTRWLKGWMQTYVVHMRHPVRLLRELGLKRFLAFQLVIAGPGLSAVVHPASLAVVLLYTLRGDLLLGGEDWADVAFRWIAGGNLFAAYIASFILAAIALRRRPMGEMTLEIVTMPFYWLLVSAAALRALVQFFRAPFRWEKTEHGRDRSDGRLALPAEAPAVGGLGHEHGGTGQFAPPQPVEGEVRLG
ncbi:hypothetical protein N177_1004 [Lutibaculum baratangense AMV1]|uniref:Glycosyl transferase, group 2 family protein n=2 Tax=Lutibaculum TaxID=1358438 RepID=V4RSN7_9HYPH|nr:hypothetical protein N177_1004 [Lutibaculum baratangense AMV1]